MRFPDHRLAQAANLIRSGRFRLLSLDIFDTIVWRTFPHPADLFYAIGREAALRGWLPESSTGEGFVALRQESEATARERRRSSSEVTLEEIYQCFPKGYLRKVGQKELLELELDIERSATRPNDEVVELARLARQRGLRLGFVSDTYFPEEHLRAVLPVEPDFLISSAAFGVPKAEGLHKGLLIASGLRPAQILHLGDNREADFEAPARLGITTLWYEKFPRDIAAAIDAELPSLRGERAQCVAEAGDCGLTSLRSRALYVNENVKDPYRAWGATVLGPAMAGFCGWIIERCRLLGIPALCLMREGRALRRIMHQLDPAFPAVEFHISRFVATKASILQGTPEELLRFFARPSPTRAAELLAHLNIDPSEAGVDPTILIDGEAVDELVRTVHRNPELRRRAVEASREERRRLLTHLSQVLPEIPRVLAVVDLGYSGTIQHCLQQILDGEGVLTRLHGLYFVTNRGISKLQKAGGAAESYLADQGQPVWFSHAFTRCPEMFEQSLMCDVGSTIGYAHDGAPLTGEIQIPAWQQEAIAKVQAGASDFLEYWARHIRTRPIRPDHLKPLIRYIVVRALTSPTQAELGAFGSWVHDENFGSSKTRTLADCRLPDVYLRHASAHQLASLRSADVYWVFGLAHRLSLVLGEAVRCIFLRKAHGDAFSAPLPKASLRFLWNDGEYRQTESEVQISNCGAVWSRYTLQFRQACLCSIGLELQQHPAGFELTGAALRLTRLGHDEETLWIGAGSFRSPDGLTAVRGKELQPNTPYSAAVEDIQDFTGVVHIDVFFRGRLREYE